MADVGRLARVSAQTVSRYFNDGYVSDDARERITAAVAELGYRQNALPRNLRRARTDSIGYANIGPLNYGGASILTGLSRAARAAGQSLLTTQLDIDPTAPESTEEVRHALETFLSLRVDGIIVGTPFEWLNDVLEAVERVVPVVGIAERLGTNGHPWSGASCSAGRLAVEHLASLGHRRILHLGGPQETNEARERHSGYRETMERLGLIPLPPRHATAWTAQAGYDAAAGINPAEFTAVFAANDLLALGLTSRLRTLGLTCPDDFSVVGVDDSPDVDFYSPPLTTVRIDFERLGELACAQLLHRIDAGGPEEPIGVDVDLRVRASTALPTVP